MGLGNLEDRYKAESNDFKPHVSNSMPQNFVSIDSLNWNRPRSLVKLVNATPSKALFSVALDSDDPLRSANVIIDPRQGALEPYGYAFVNVSLPQKEALPIKLRVHYKRFGLARHEPDRVRRTIELNVNRSLEKCISTRGDHFLFIIAFCRAFLIIVLIICNVDLIKQILWHRW